MLKSSGLAIICILFLTGIIISLIIVGCGDTGNLTGNIPTTPTVLSTPTPVYPPGSIAIGGYYRGLPSGINNSSVEVVLKSGYLMAGQNGQAITTKKLDNNAQYIFYGLNYGQYSVDVYYYNPSTDPHYDPNIPLSQEPALLKARKWTNIDPNIQGLIDPNGIVITDIIDGEKTYKAPVTIKGQYLNSQGNPATDKAYKINLKYFKNLVDPNSATEPNSNRDPNAYYLTQTSIQDPNATYIFNNVSPGTYIVEAINPDDMMPLGQTKQSVDGTSVNIIIKENQFITITPTPTSTTPTVIPTGSVTATPTGSATAGPTGTGTPIKPSGPVAVSILSNSGRGYVVNQTSGNISLFTTGTNALIMSSATPLVINAVATATPGIEISGKNSLADSFAGETNAIYVADTNNGILWILSGNIDNRVQGIKFLKDSTRSNHDPHPQSVSGKKDTRIVLTSTGNYDELIHFVPGGTVQYYDFNNDPNYWTGKPYPIDVVMSGDGQNAFAALHEDYSIGVINLLTGHAVGRIAMDETEGAKKLRPLAMDIDTANNRGVAVCIDGTLATSPQIVVFSTISPYKVLGRLKLTYKNSSNQDTDFYPYDVIINPNGSRTMAYVCGANIDNSLQGVLAIGDISSSGNPTIFDKNLMPGKQNPIDLKTTAGQEGQIRFGRSLADNPSQFYVVNNSTNSFSVLNFTTYGVDNPHVFLNPTPSSNPTPSQ